MEEPIRKLGPYTLVRKIGLGGFGVVWLAEKRTAIATTQFALKLPRNEDVDIDAFKQEAAIWIQASGHPNVLPIIEADEYDGQVIIVSEYAPDGSLSDILQNKQPLEVKRAVIAISNGPIMAANFPSKLKKPKYSPDFSGGINWANKDLDSACTPP